MSIYEVNNNPTVKKINKYDDESDVYYRFQMKDWEMGNQSWGMIYDSAEEAREAYEEEGLEPEEAVLNGKCCCSTAKELYSFVDAFDSDFRILVISGDYVEEGHDGEDVVDVDEILEIWDFNKFIELIGDMEEE